MPRRTPHAALERLNVLVGEWKLQASVGGQPVGRARAVFAWLEGGAFLVQHTDAEPAEFEPPPEWVANSPFPIATIIGLDDATKRFSMLYGDARGVFRVYQMSLVNGFWKVWREAPGFHQRFTGTFSDDNTTITARWEKSDDGSRWEYDFDLNYRKVV